MNDTAAIEIPWKLWNRLPVDIQRGFRLVALRGSRETAQGFLLVADPAQVRSLEDWARRLGFTG